MKWENLNYIRFFLKKRKIKHQACFEIKWEINVSTKIHTAIFP